MKSYVEKIKEIQDELKWDSELFESEIQIEMDDDIVSLTGIVESEQHKTTAENIVRKIEGVKSVINNLQVLRQQHKPDEPMEVPSSNAGEPDNTLKLSGA